MEPLDSERRLSFIDAVRGAAIFPMVVNHTGSFWFGAANASADILSYSTVTTAAPLFMFIAGVSIPLSWARAAASGTRYRVWARTATLRAAWLIIVGYALNRLLFPGRPLLLMGPLQTIGAVALALIAILPWLKSRWATVFLVTVSLASYALFAYEVPALNALVQEHLSWGDIFFFSMPTWPWASWILLGAALGTRWCACESEKKRETVLRVSALLGAVFILAGLAVFWLCGKDDYTIDFIGFSTWFPGPGTALWITGLTPVVLLVFRKLEKFHALPKILIVFGQRALMIYVVHRIFVIAIMAKALHFMVWSWTSFAVANVELFLALAGLTLFRNPFLLVR